MAKRLTDIDAMELTGDTYKHNIWFLMTYGTIDSGKVIFGTWKKNGSFTKFNSTITNILNGRGIRLSEQMDTATLETVMFTLEVLDIQMLEKLNSTDGAVKVAAFERLKAILGVDIDDKILEITRRHRKAYELSLEYGLYWLIAWIKGLFTR